MTTKRAAVLFLVLLATTAFAQSTPSTQAPSSHDVSNKRARGKLAAKGAQNGASALGDFDEYVRKTMSDWKVPGAAIAVVKDGKVILSRVTVCGM